MSEPLIIYGGSFDPIHNGHLRIAKETIRKLGGKLFFVPAKNPRWKETASSEEDRLKMIELALEEANEPSFHIDTIEYSRTGLSYSVDTVRYFLDKYRGRDIYFLIGGDQVNSFPKWKDAKEISSSVKVIYSERNDIKIDPSITKDYNLIPLGFDKAGEISSSSIRSLQMMDEPDPVRHYIEDNDLYYMQKMHEYLGEKRLRHSIRVANLAYELAISNHFEHPWKAYIAGVLHDIGKEMPREQSDALMAKEFPEWASYPHFCHHQFVGAYLAKKDFGITDQEILEAIMSHCTGKANMNDLGIVVFEADKTDPGRGYDSKYLIDGCKKDFKKGFKTLLEQDIEYFKNKGIEVKDDLTLGCFNYYLKK